MGCEMNIKEYMNYDPYLGRISEPSPQQGT